MAELLSIWPVNRFLGKNWQEDEMRVGQNPAKSLKQVEKPAEITVAITTYIPFLSGYYEQSLDVFKTSLNSLLEAGEPEFDLLVFDNGSCAQVREFLIEQRDQGNIQFLILSEKNLGVGGAWDIIFAASPGKVIAYSDYDILYRPGWLEESLRVLETFPKVGMVTARPLRSPEEYYSSFQIWAEDEPEAEVERGKFLDWETYLEHSLSCGAGIEESREWYQSREDYKVTYQGVSVYAGSGHFQFSAYREVLAEVLPLNMDHPMGSQVRWLDIRLNEKGFSRVCLPKPLVKHIGNRLDNIEKSVTRVKSVQEKGSGRRLLENPLIKKLLLRLYEKIFKAYYD
jgi:glycosyltransferase involved in cell wall biosynthesis